MNANATISKPVTSLPVADNGVDLPVPASVLSEPSPEPSSARATSAVASESEPEPATETFHSLSGRLVRSTVGVYAPSP